MDWETFLWGSAVGFAIGVEWCIYLKRRQDRARRSRP